MMIGLALVTTALAAVIFGLLPAVPGHRAVRLCDAGWAAGLWLATWVFCLCAYHRPGLTVGFGGFRLLAITALCSWAGFCSAGLRIFWRRGAVAVLPLL